MTGRTGTVRHSSRMKNAAEYGLLPWGLPAAITISEKRMISRWRLQSPRDKIPQVSLFIFWYVKIHNRVLVQSITSRIMPQVVMVMGTHLLSVDSSLKL